MLQNLIDALLEFAESSNIEILKVGLNKDKIFVIGSKGNSPFSLVLDRPEWTKQTY